MTIKESLNLGAKKLLTKSTSAQLDSEVLICFVLGKDKSYIFAHADDQLSDEQSKQYLRLIARRAKRMPVAYLTGSKEFAGLNFIVNKNVLIPRPETELLVEKVIDAIGKKKNLKILDIGTGSGAIIVALAHQLKNKHEYFASDVSAKALEVARLNAKNLGGKITFKQASLFKNWEQNEFDIVTANLPYLAEKTMDIKFEPTLALVARNKGLHIIKNLIMQVKNLPAKPPHIFLEIGHGQKLPIKKLATQYLPAYKIRCFKDYAGFDRVIWLSR